MRLKLKFKERLFTQIMLVIVSLALVVIGVLNVKSHYVMGPVVILGGLWFGYRAYLCFKNPFSEQILECEDFELVDDAKEYIPEKIEMPTKEELDRRLKTPIQELD